MAVSGNAGDRKDVKQYHLCERMGWVLLTGTCSKETIAFAFKGAHPDTMEQAWSQNHPSVSLFSKLSPSPADCKLTSFSGIKALGPLVNGGETCTLFSCKTVTQFSHCQELHIHLTR